MLKSNLGQTVIAPGATENFRLPTTHYLHGIALRLSLALTGGTSAAIKQDALARAIQRIRVYYGNTPAWDVSGETLLYYLRHHLGVAQDYTEFPGGTGAQTATWNLVIPTSDQRLVTNPSLTAVDLRLANEPRVEITLTGSVTVVTPTGGSTLGNLTVNALADLTPIPANVPQIAFTPMRYFRSSLVTALAASTPDQARDITKGRFVRTFMFLARNQAAASAVRSDALVDSVELIPNRAQLGRVSWTDMRSMARARYGFVPDTGIALMDFDPSRSLSASTMLDLRGGKDNQLAIGTNALPDGLDFTVFSEEIVLPRPEDVQAAYAAMKGSG